MNSENRDFRESFASTASDYRRRELQLRFVLIPHLLIFWYVMLFLPAARLLAFLSFPLFFAALLWGKHTSPKLVCPACEHETDGEVIRFCPECGSGRVQNKGQDQYFLLWPRCQACGKELSRKRGGERRYRIRFCTRCGAYLDERGI